MVKIGVEKMASKSLRAIKRLRQKSRKMKLAMRHDDTLKLDKKIHAFLRMQG